MKKHINKFGIIALVVMIAFFAAGCESPLTLLDREGDNPGTGPDKPTTGSDFTQVDKSNFDSNKPPAVPAAPTGLYAYAGSDYIDITWNTVSVLNANITYYVSISGPISYSTYRSTDWYYYSANLPNGTYTVDVYAIAENDNGEEWSLLPSSTSVTVNYYNFSGTSWEFITYDYTVSPNPPDVYTLTISFLSNGTFIINGSIWDDIGEEEITYNNESGSYTVRNGGYADLTDSDGDTYSTSSVSGYPSEYFEFLGTQFYKVYP